jgi:Icc-related predicted phosphoesterase
LPLFGKKDKVTEKKTRIFFATDVHGSEPTFKKFVNAGRVYSADVLVLGGDITGKMITPIVKQSDGSYVSHFLEQKQIVKNDEELKVLEKRILTTGAYTTVMEQKEFETISADEKKLDDLFKRLMRERLSRWIDLTNERLKDTHITCYITGGNDDAQDIVDLIVDTDHVKNPDNKIVRIDDLHEMASLGWGNPTPWKTPRECSDEEIRERVERLVSGIQDMKNAIFNFHIPPKDSELDDAPQLDTSVYPPQPIYKAGQILTYGAGSQSIRNAIEKNQPLLGLHGHIHESKGARKIGRTLCVNPGSEYGESILRGAIIDIADAKVLNYQFVSG